MASMEIHEVRVKGHLLRFCNDADSRGPAWKTKIDSGIWSYGVPTLDEALQKALDDLLAPKRRSTARK